MSGRPSTSRQILDDTGILMDGLLVEENNAAMSIAAGLRGVTATLTERITAAAAGNQRSPRANLSRKIPRLIPTPEQVINAVGPPIGHLLAVSREQVLPVIGRQLRACAGSVGPAATMAANAGVTAAQAAAGDLEARYYAAACAAIGAAVVANNTRLAEQARIWRLHPAEGPDELIRRWCSEDPVRLPGATGRGVLWTLRTAATARAREASISVVNGLLLAGYGGWNTTATTS
jgi:hypothetical protein